MKTYRDNFYSLPESLNKEEYIIGKYIVSVDTDDYLKYAGMLAVQESTGSWVHLPMETPGLVSRHGAIVINAFEVPDYEYDQPTGKRIFIFEIAFPIINFGYQIPMLINSIIGVISYFGDIKLVDIVFPESFVKAFPGPKYGVDKIRDYLNVTDRPLCGCILKPATGLNPKQAGHLFYQASVGGANLIKDDEKIANASYSSVANRVRECMNAEKRAYEETGKHTLYAVNITDTPDKVLDNAKAAIDAGGNMLMLSHLTVGIGMVQVLAEAEEFDVPIQVHPDFLGGASRSYSVGMSSNLSIGKIPRLCGADVSCYAISFVPVIKEKLVKVAIALQSPFYGLKRAWPLVGGGMHPGMVQFAVNNFGNDIVLCAGGGIHAHPMGVTAGAKAMCQAIDAAIEGKSVRETGKEFKELSAAIDAWGVIGEENIL